MIIVVDLFCVIILRIILEYIVILVIYSVRGWVRLIFGVNFIVN